VELSSIFAKGRESLVSLALNSLFLYPKFLFIIFSLSFVMRSQVKGVTKEA